MDEQNKPLTSQKLPAELKLGISQNNSLLNSKRPLIIAIGVLILFVLVGGYFLSKKQAGTSSSRSSVSPILQPSLQIEKTVNWKTFTISDKVSFKYPADYIIQESAPDFFNIYNGPGNLGMSIDARLAGSYADFSTAVNNTKKGLVNPVVNNLDNGVKISGKIGPGYREGADIIIILYKLNTAAVEVERSNDLIPLETFNKILKSFKLTE